MISKAIRVEKETEKVKPIMFSPKFEVGEDIFIMHNNKIIEGGIMKRKFIDEGECEGDIRDKKFMKMCDEDLINAKYIREITTMYVISTNEEYDLIRDESEIWRTKEEYKESI